MRSYFSLKYTNTLPPPHLREAVELLARRLCVHQEILDDEASRGFREARAAVLHPGHLGFIFI